MTPFDECFMLILYSKINKLKVFLLTKSQKGFQKPANQFAKYPSLLNNLICPMTFCRPKLRGGAVCGRIGRFPCLNRRQVCVRLPSGGITMLQCVSFLDLEKAAAIKF